MSKICDNSYTDVSDNNAAFEYTTYQVKYFKATYNKLVKNYQ